MDAKELKPCPFCGAKACLEDARTIWIVRCGACSSCVLGERAPEPDGSESDEYWQRIEQTAIDAWNRRAAIPSDAAQAPNDVRIPMDIAIDARRMRTLRRLLDAMDDLGNGFPGAVHAAFQDGGQSTCRALDEAATPEDLIHAVPVTPAAAALIEREARALRLLEIAEPILEGAAAGQRVTMAAGTLLRQVRAFLPDSTAPTPTVAADAAAPSPLLAADHKGMRVDYSGVFKQATAALARGGKEPGIAEMLRQMKEHITELGTRWYAGDTAVVDELLQLYCVEKDARDALVASSGAAQ